jgi:hypothetical protein
MNYLSVDVTQYMIMNESSFFRWMKMLVALLGVLLISLVCLLSKLFSFLDVGFGERGGISDSGFQHCVEDFFIFLFELARTFGSTLLLLMVTRIWNISC